MKVVVPQLVAFAGAAAAAAVGSVTAPSYPILRVYCDDYYSPRVENSGLHCYGRGGVNTTAKTSTIAVVPVPNPSVPVLKVHCPENHFPIYTEDGLLCYWQAPRGSSATPTASANERSPTPSTGPSASSLPTATTT